MSEASKVIMDKANQIQLALISEHAETVRVADKVRGVMEARYTRLVLAAQEVCEHTEELSVTKARAEQCSHPRYMEKYQYITCAICNKWLRNE